MLEVMRDYFSVSSKRMLEEIQSMRQIVEDMLVKKGIRYEDLKTALVPDSKRRDIALVFDSCAAGGGWYGHAVFKKLIPLLDVQAKHSILAADYLGRQPQTGATVRGAARHRSTKALCRIPAQFPVFYRVYQQPYAEHGRADRQRACKLGSLCRIRRYNVRIDI